VYKTVYDSAYDLLPKMISNLILDQFFEKCEYGCLMKNITTLCACKSNLKSYRDFHTELYAMALDGIDLRFGTLLQQ
jgi:hypothetical protein